MSSRYNYILINYIKKITGISITPSTVELDLGKTVKLTAKITPENATNKTLYWSSNNDNVTVDQTGLVTAKKVGESIITATSKDGSKVKGQATVKVKNPIPIPIAGWNIKKEGKNNDSPEREILKDLTGNGHDITLKNFLFAGMSGYGGYAIKSKNIVGWALNPDRYDSLTYENYKFTVVNIKGNNNFLAYIPINNFAENETKIKVYVTGLSNGKFVRFGTAKIYNNGINEIVLEQDINGLIGIASDYLGGNVTLEFLPEYEGALVFDGVDDRGICENMPEVDDCTLIIKRIILSSKTQFTAVYGTNSASDNALNYMWLEYENKNSNFIKTYSFGNGIDITSENRPIITYQTKNSYNGITIKQESPLKEKGTIFSLGCCQNIGSYSANMAFYCAYLFDRSLTEEEIEAFVKSEIDPDYILPSTQTNLLLDQGNLDTNTLG